MTDFPPRRNRPPRAQPRRQEHKAPGDAQEQGDQDVTVLSGLKPVLELLERDPARIDLVMLRKGRRSPDTDRLLDLCREHGVRFSLTDAAALDRLCPTGHQGVAARLFSAGFVQLETLLDTAMDAPLPLIVVLDQVQDAGNAGALARTLYALGGAGLVIPQHNGVYLGAGARRVAAGALEQLPVAKVTNISRALDMALDRGFAVYAAARNDGENERSAFDIPLHTPALLVLGSEERGLRPQVLSRCQQTLYVPMLRDFDSLNVAQAGGILISCFLRRALDKEHV